VRFFFINRIVCVFTIAMFCQCRAKIPMGEPAFKNSESDEWRLISVLPYARQRFEELRFGDEAED